MKSTLGKYFSGVTLIALIAIFTPTAAFASATAKASNPSAHSISSVTFKVAPENTTGGTASGLLTWTANSTTDIYFYYVNTGTIQVNSFNWTITRTVGSGGFTITKCPINTTFSTATRCSDSSTPTSMTATGTTGPTLTPGQWLPVYINITSKTDTFTGASTVSRSQIRAGTNTVA